MLNPLSPDAVIRILVLVGLLGASWGSGFVVGLQHEDEKHTRFRVDVESATKVQAAATEAKVEKQKSITKEVSNAYLQNINALHAHYAGRLRQQSGGGGIGLPAIPEDSGAVRERSADAGSGAAEPAPTVEACAVTTFDYLWLRHWVTEQGKE